MHEDRNYMPLGHGRDEALCNHCNTCLTGLCHPGRWESTDFEEHVTVRL